MMQSGLTVQQKGVILVTFPLIVGLLFIVILSSMLRQAEYQAEIEAHARDISARAEYINSILDVVPKAAMRYVDSGEKASLMSSDKYMEKFSTALNSLATIAQTDAHEARIVEMLKLLAARMVEDYDQIKGVMASDLREDKKRSMLEPNVRRMWKDGFEGVTQVERLLLLESRYVSARHHDAAQRRESLKIAVYVGVAAYIFVALLLAAFFTMSITRRLQVVTDNTFRLVSKKQLHPVLSGRDEIAHLDKVFHNMAEALDAAAKKEEELQRIKKEVMNMVTHDLRSPLASIVASLEILQLGAWKDDAQRSQNIIDTASRSSQRLLKLVNELLEVEKLSAGHIDVILMPVSLASVFESAMESVREGAHKKQVALAAVRTDAEVLGDESRLVQVMVNLLSNAINYSDAGSVVKIEVEAGPEHTTVAVVDDGCGIPDAFHDVIFERFKQVESRSKKKGGTGLGLPICKMLVEAMKGTIGVQSVAGKGSRFWFKLPTAPS